MNESGKLYKHNKAFGTTSDIEMPVESMMKIGHQISEMVNEKEVELQSILTDEAMSDYYVKFTTNDNNIDNFFLMKKGGENQCDTAILLGEMIYDEATAKDLKERTQGDFLYGGLDKTPCLSFLQLPYSFPEMSTVEEEIEYSKKLDTITDIMAIFLLYNTIHKKHDFKPTELEKKTNIHFTRYSQLTMESELVSFTEYDMLNVENFENAITSENTVSLYQFSGQEELKDFYVKIGYSPDKTTTDNFSIFKAENGENIHMVIGQVFYSPKMLEEHKKQFKEFSEMYEEITDFPTVFLVANPSEQFLDLLLEDFPYLDTFDFAITMASFHLILRREKTEEQKAFLN